MMTVSVHSESETSEDEWIRCADEVTVEESFMCDSSRRGLRAEVTASLFFPRHDSNSYATYAPDRHLEDLYTDAIKAVDDTKAAVVNTATGIEQPTAFSTLLGATTAKECTKEAPKNEEPLSCQEKAQCIRSSTTGPRQAHSLEDFGQVPETVINSEKGPLLFKTKITDAFRERHFVKISNVPENSAFANCEQTVGHKIEESDEDEEDTTRTDQIVPLKLSRLPPFYEFAFDIKNLNVSGTVFPAIEANTPLRPLVSKYQAG